MHQPHSEHRLISQAIDPSSIKPADMGDMLQKTFGITFTKKGALATFKSDGVIETGAYKMPSIKQGVVLRRVRITDGHAIVTLRRNNVPESYINGAIQLFMEKLQAFAGQNSGKTFDFKFHDPTTIENPGDIEPIHVFTAMEQSDGTMQVVSLETKLGLSEDQRISALDIQNGTISIAAYNPKKKSSTVSRYNQDLELSGKPVDIDGFTYRLTNDGDTLILGTLDVHTGTTKVEVLGSSYTSQSTLRNFPDQGIQTRLVGLERTSSGILGTCKDGQMFLCTKKGLINWSTTPDGGNRLLGTVGSNEDSIAVSTETGVQIRQFGQASSAGASA